MPSWLALGDSYTIGEAVPEHGRWPVQLARRLRAHGVAIDEPRILATTGWTTDELAAAMDAARLALPGDDAGTGTFDLVSLLIGVNNQYRGRPLDEYSEQFAALLARAIALAGHRPDRVFVLAIPDWGVTPFGQDSGRDTARIAAELDAFNAAAAAECARRGVAFVDIAPVSRACGAVLVAADGLHPSADLHGEWARLAEPVVLRLLGAPLPPSLCRSGFSRDASV
ncbi:GDSL-type esterase/lipase family protein [Arenimonas composti]|uniref:SGNH hydrolase-type esterase domain-containing protein n=1 Tax=Arenimonas composti TR7-09 = DSM 18010 TaxID=1121013 RepID=A0A091BXH8_9GAMM|nr:GDSL-type esterase/lipase family protein [Arenimonas composti]KFN49050.1 hypothetical protein P873_12530 [Arenimonas composti TR7-09 = DSM 18010]